MATKGSLKTYRKRRNLKRSPEPYGKVRPARGNRFVIQKHKSRNLHYDFRLQIGGVLKSWAVPKGPSLNPKDKRLALPTDDHPVVYAKFEGVIPEDAYGAGTVMVWDIGTFKNIKKKDGKKVSMEDAYDDGEISVWLEGEKLQGGFALVRTSDDRWLLIKKRDEHASARRNPVSTQNKSALTGRTMAQIKKGA